MNKYSVLNGLNSEEINGLSVCLHFEERNFKKGDTIMKLSENTAESGILRSGLAYLKSIDDQGEENILDLYREGSIFGSILSMDTDVNLYYIFAKTDCTVSFFSTKAITGLCSNMCARHIRFIENVITSSVCRSRIHIDILSQRTIRKKLLTFYKYFVQDSEKVRNEMPFTLSDLAEYICVDRSAMMRELAKMERENIIF